MSERVVKTQLGAAKGLASTFENAALEENASPLKFLLSLYKGNFANLLISLLFLFIKSAPIYVLPIVTANIINIATNPAKYPLSGIWINFVIILIVILQNIPTHAAYISF